MGTVLHGELSLLRWIFREQVIHEFTLNRIDSDDCCNSGDARSQDSAQARGFLELIDTVRTDQPIAIETDQSKRDDLHAVAGAEAAKYKGG